MRKYNKSRRHHFGQPREGYEFCTICEQEKLLSEFTKCLANPSGVKSHCKQCRSIRTKERRIRARKIAIEYLGGSCKECAYNEFECALEFHHINPNTKDATIAKKLSQTINIDNVKAELDKCVLLCAICHRKVHAGIIMVSK